MTAKLCQICGEGRLQEQVKNDRVLYRNIEGKVSFHFSICNVCGSVQADAAQLRANKREMAAFKNHVDGLLL